MHEDVDAQATAVIGPKAPGVLAENHDPPPPVVVRKAPSSSPTATQVVVEAQETPRNGVETLDTTDHGTEGAGAEPAEGDPARTGANQAAASRSTGQSWRTRPDSFGPKERVGEWVRRPSAVSSTGMGQASHGGSGAAIVIRAGFRLDACGQL